MPESTSVGYKTFEPCSCFLLCEFEFQRIAFNGSFRISKGHRVAIRIHDGLALGGGWTPHPRLRRTLSPRERAVTHAFCDLGSALHPMVSRTTISALGDQSPR